MPQELVRGASTAHPFNVAYRVKRIGPHLSGRWLDLGCADGGYTRALLDYGASEVFGADLEPDRVKAAGEAVPDARFLAVSSESLPFRASCFDGVFMNEVLEHVRSEALTLGEVRRILRPDGKLILMSPNRGFPFEGHEVRIAGWHSKVPTPLIPWLPRLLTDRWVTARNYWPGELTATVEAAGLVVIEAGFVMPVLENYPWLPPRAVARWQQMVATLDGIAGVRRFGVSLLVIAVRKEGVNAAPRRRIAV